MYNQIRLLARRINWKLVCTVAAAVQEMRTVCAGLKDNLVCRREYLSQVGTWSQVNGTSCYPACTRQTNKLEISNVRFPNLEFVDRPQFWKVARKLFWSCSQELTRHGRKRKRLEENYPELCSFYDKYFYKNDKIKEMFQQGRIIFKYSSH